MVAKLLLGMLVFGAVACAQSVPAFDVASVHENKDGGGGSAGMSEGRYRAVNMPLRILISSAYGIRPDLVTGTPGWTESTHYNVDAKVDEAEAAALDKMPSRQKEEEQRKLIQALLQERFHLQATVVEKELPVYDLVIAKGGPKIRESVPDASGNTKLLEGKYSFQSMPGKMIAAGFPLPTFIANLAGQLDRAVIDKTGLTGKYDFTLQWTRDSAANTDSPWPDLFTAIQEQLGLKLLPSKGMQKTLVVENVERPTEN